MTYRLRVLWSWLTGDPPPRCRDCGRRILGDYASSMNAPAERPECRCWPACRPRP